MYRSCTAAAAGAGPKELLLRLVENYYPLPPDPDAEEAEAGGPGRRLHAGHHLHATRSFGGMLLSSLPLPLPA